MKAQPGARIEPHDLEPRTGDTQVTERMAEVSPRFQARMAGVIAWITTTAGFAEIVRGRLVVYGDAAATAHNILEHEMFYRLAFAGDVISLLYIAYTLLLYNLFRPVNRSLSLLAAFFSLVGCAIATFNSLFLLAPLVVLGDAQSLSALNVKQLQELALLFLKLHAQGYNISMVLFGSYNLLIGYLIFRSTFLPRILGVLLAISGLCYLINCFANFLSPTFAAHLLPYILVPGGAELVLALWLVVIGVNAQRWKEQASAAGTSIRT
jgi:hypothetical protein